MHLEHFGNLRDAARGLLRPGAIAVADEDEREQRKLDGGRVDPRAVPLDDSAFLELANPLEHGGRRQIHLAGDLGVRNPSV